MIPHQIVHFHGSSDFMGMFVLLFARVFFVLCAPYFLSQSSVGPLSLKKGCAHRIPVRKKNKSSPRKLILPVTNVAVIE